MKRLNLVIVAVGAAAAWYLNYQIGAVEDQFSSQAQTEFVSQGATFWSLASIGRELEMMQYVIAESFPVFLGAFVIIGLLVYAQLLNKDHEKVTASDEFVGE